ncbi:heterokaryon incompatibility protein-domain-containing protein, partial [Phaeosphaeria sp. MPI-PUGE-AT-0046c]
MRLWRSSPYRAHPLNLNNSTNIRVIELLPGRPEAPLSCKLHVLPLENEPVFTALSYVWGDETNTKSILLDGKHHIVRENLWNFLAQYRRSEYTSRLWIDALCIDQSSIIERNHQVALMGKIYSSAKLVITWLGHGFSSCLSHVSTFDACTSNIQLYANSMIQLSSSPYWTRLWIVQEFVLAANINIWSDAETTDGHMLAKAYMRYKQQPYGLTSNLKFDEFHILDENFQRLNNFAHAGCADARDRVYGVLGLLDPDELTKHPIVPDYSKPPSALFREIFV